MHLYVLQRSPIVLVLLWIMLIVYSGFAQLAVPVTGSAAGGADYIVQAANSTAAAAAVEQAGGTVSHQLGIINAVAAQLEPTALARLQANPQLTLHPDTTLRNASFYNSTWWETDTRGFDLYPTAAVNVQALHEQRVSTPDFECDDQRVTFDDDWNSERLNGSGVTVAVVDSGVLPMASHSDWRYRDSATGTLIAESEDRCLIYRDFVDPANVNNSIDDNGHGTHIVTTIADNRRTIMGDDYSFSRIGIAPRANLVVARALRADGSGSYADVIAAIDWIVANKDTYAIRVLNLSLYAPITGYYWQDPLNQAVMRAWQAGIVVVTVAGNDGPAAGTITAPGNVPYVITVGALTSGRYTESGRDELADYSARGPTESAFVKPDVLVPATRTIAVMPTYSYLAQQLGSDAIVSYDRGYLDLGRQTWHQTYYELSGTSMAAAQVSGIVALMVQANPDLSPDQVKYRLMATARPALDAVTNEPLYTAWEQGAGLVDAEAAVFAETLEAANTGLDIALDLDPNSAEHHWGFTTWDEATGEFRLVDPTTGEPIQIWEGGRRSYAGGEWLWTGGRRSYAGSDLTWAGGRRSYAGSDLTWAGSAMTWTQPADRSAGALSSDLVLDPDIAVDEAAEPAQRGYTVWLPVVTR